MAEMTEFFDAGMEMPLGRPARRCSGEGVAPSGLPGLGKCIALGRVARRCSIESDGKLSLPMSEFAGFNNKGIALGKAGRRRSEDDDFDDFGKMSLPMSEFGDFDKGITLGKAGRRCSEDSDFGKMSLPMSEFGDFDKGITLGKAPRRRSEDDGKMSLPMSEFGDFDKGITLGKAPRRRSEDDGKMSLPMSDFGDFDKCTRLGKAGRQCSIESDGKVSLPMSDFGGGLDKSITLSRALRRLSFASTADGGFDGKLSFPMSDFSNSSVALSEFASTFAGDSASEGAMSLPMSDFHGLDKGMPTTIADFATLEKAVLTEDSLPKDAALEDFGIDKSVPASEPVGEEKGPEAEHSLGMAELLKLDRGIPFPEFDSVEEMAAVVDAPSTTLTISEVPAMLADWASWEFRRQKVLQKRLLRRSERYSSKADEHARGFCSSDCNCCPCRTQET